MELHSLIKRTRVIKKANVKSVTGKPEKSLVIYKVSARTTLTGFAEHVTP
jgi:hypothetical protein